MDTVSYCKHVWSTAESDTEKFAALLVITKAGKSSDLSSSERREIFECIGFSFLSRLIHTKEVPQDCPAAIYKAVALSILSCFCTDTQITESNEMCSLIPELKNILDAEFCKKEESLVMDVLHCLHDMSYGEKGRDHMLQQNVVSSLVNLYVSDMSGKSMALSILENVAFHLSSDTWKNNSVPFYELLSRMCEEFHEDNLNEELCKSIFFLLYNPVFKIEGNEDYAVQIQMALTNILRCKVRKRLRDLAIKLASLMVEKCGTYWFENHTDINTQFYLVLIQVVSVEVRVVLEDRPLETIAEEDVLLCACYSILERVISAMVNQNMWFSSNLYSYSKELITSVRTAYKAVLGFLRTVSAQWDSLANAIEFDLKQLTCVSIRALCAWLAEETGVFQDEVCEVLPFILHVCSEYFVGMEFEDAEYAPADVTDFDIMQFFVHALGHLTADDTSRAVLLESKLMKTLFHYTYYKWNLYQRSASCEIETLLSSICDAILNVVVMEPRTVSESEEFYHFLRFLFEAVLHIPSDSENLKTLILKANFSVLGLLITKQFHRRIKACETSFYKFLSFSVKFLWDAHHVEYGVFSLVRQYHYVWPDVKELWFLGMQALSTLVPVMQWIASFLIESGWPQQIIILFLRAEENMIDKSVKYTYQAFLCSLVRVNCDAKRTLTDCDAIIVCKKHELNELEMLLNK